MFLEKILIQNKESIIREINFHKGINLLVDETPLINSQQTTGNNVGKTTVLRLVDYCFGSDGKNIYQDTEFNKQPNTTIEKFLKDNEVIITIQLVDNLDFISNRITIRKNFLQRSKKIQEINNQNIPDNRDFGKKLKELIFNSNVEKPSFKQIISKNIRDEKNKLANIVKVLNSYTTAEEYEALYLFWLGINTDKHSVKEQLAKEKTKEENFQRRLKKDGELSFIEQQLAIINDKINVLTNKKNNLTLTENYNLTIETKNNLKLLLNRKVTELSTLELRKDLINESKDDLEQEYTSIDTLQIKKLYEKAKMFIPSLQVSFEETVKFHNDLISEKLKYITKELPELEHRIKEIKTEIKRLNEEENKLSIFNHSVEPIEEYDKLLIDLNRLFEQKGSLEKQINYWIGSKERLTQIEQELKIINTGIYSKDVQIQNRITEFNKSFVKMSLELYGEEYLLSTTSTEKGYGLTVDNLAGNVGTGKKKGQIAAFDFAYIEFADKMDIECLHFIMHDQLETIHNNQLSTLIAVANKINGQYIVPILRDKIPPLLDITDFEVLSLSQNDKLFKI